MGLTSSPPSAPSLSLSPFHQVRYLKFDLTTCFSSKSSVHQHLMTFCSTARWATVVFRSISLMGLTSSPPSAPLVAAQSISSGEVPEIRSNYLFFLEIISTSASADDVVVQPDGQRSSFDLSVSSLGPIVAAQSISSDEVPEIRSNCLFFLEIISTSASADDVVVQPDGQRSSFDLSVSSLGPIVAAQSISSDEVPEIRSNCLFFLEIISTSASADDVCSTARWATVVFRSISQLAGDPWGARSIPRRGRLSVRVLVAFNAVEPERQAVFWA